MANKVYVAPETAIVFKSSGGDAVLTSTSLANGAGRISAQFDRGAGSKAMRYRWQLRVDVNVTPTTGEVIRLYAAGSDGTDQDGNIGTADAAVTDEDRFRNLQLLGHGVQDEETGNIIKASGICWIFSRYISVGLWNALGQALTATAGDHYVTLIPMPDEVQ